jgi:hypothetical protein
MSLIAITVGCGEGGEASSSRLGKGEFLRRANAICKEARAGLLRKVSDFEARAKQGPYVDAVHWVLLPTIEEEIRQVQELDILRKEAGRVDALLDAQQATLDSLAVKPAVPRLEIAARRFAKPGRQLRAYGLAACAFGPISLRPG